jgi:hypothetical protein
MAATLFSTMALMKASFLRAKPANATKTPKGFGESVMDGWMDGWMVGWSFPRALKALHP